MTMYLSCNNNCLIIIFISIVIKKCKVIYNNHIFYKNLLFKIKVIESVKIVQDENMADNNLKSSNRLKKVLDKFSQTFKKKKIGMITKKFLFMIQLKNKKKIKPLTMVKYLLEMLMNIK